MVIWCGRLVGVMPTPGQPPHHTAPSGVPTAPALVGSVRFDHGLLNSVGGEDVAAGVSDVRASGEAEGVEGQVAEAGRGPWGGTGPELGAVLVEDHVPSPM